MTDKSLHFIVGAVVYLLAMLTPVPPFVAVVAIGAGKEAFDAAMDRGVPEVADFAFTCLGGLVIQGVRAC